MSVFDKRPWTTPEFFVEGMPAGMLSVEEGTLLSHLAENYFTGRGEIIDAGAFLGASSFCLAKGLDANRTVGAKAGRLHAYDLFEVWREQETSWTFMASELKRIFNIDVADGQSTLPIYMRNLERFASLVRVHVGDIMATTWSGRPIEILFLDICKTRAIWQHVLRTFYPSLMPGISLVIHQDYHHPLLPFLHVVQERLADYFEIVEEKVTDSTVFLLRDRIPDGVLAEVASYDFTTHDELRLMDKAIARLPDNNHHLMVAKAQLLRQHGDIKSSRLLLDEMKDVASRSGADPRLAGYIGFVERNLFRDEAATAEVPSFFNEAAYLRANPDVRQALNAGLLDSGFQHYCHFGEREGRALV